MTKETSLKWVGINAPRYTSYPTAPHFNADINDKNYDDWLSQIKDDSSVSLYIHIPFCKKLCWFCGCNTSIVDHYQPIATYLEFLLKEISILAQKINQKSQITHIHFGGGSPTILNIEDFSKIIELIQSKFQVIKTPQISIEIDPRNVNKEKIELYGKIGVNRASIGVQDFNHKTQEAVNRIQPFNMVKDLFEQLRENNINNINIDLIYGLPFQTSKSIEETINLSLTLNPSRIALFSYAHVPHFKTHQNFVNQEAIVSDDERLRMFLSASKIIEKQSYKAIGIDHFARLDDELTIALKEKVLRRNFQGYVADNADSLIGVGLSSIGQLNQGYIQNSSKFKEYKNLLNKDQLPVIRGVATSREDKIRKEIIDKLMCYMEVNLAEVIKKHDLSDDYFHKELGVVSRLYQGTAQVDNQTIKVICKHKMSTRAIALIFDEYQSKNNNYSKLV